MGTRYARPMNTAVDAMLSTPATASMAIAPSGPAAMPAPMITATTNTSTTWAQPSANWNTNRLTINELRAIGMLSNLSR